MGMSSEIPEESAVELAFGEFTDTDTRKKGIRIEVRNTGKKPIDSIKVEWVYEYEKPQDATAEFAALHGEDISKATGRKPNKVDEVGRRYSFNLSRGESSGPLAVGEERLYLFPPEWLPDMCSLVQSLSPDRYRVAITIDSEESVGIPGSVFGEFVERRFGTDQDTPEETSPGE